MTDWRQLIGILVDVENTGNSQGEGGRMRAEYAEDKIAVSDRWEGSV